MTEAFDATNIVSLDALQAVFDYEDTVRRNVLAGTGLLLHGESGGGKSRLAAQIGLAALLSGLKVRFGSLSELLAGIKASFDLKDGSGDVLWAAYAEGCDLLVLDDLGVENATPWVQERAYTLLDTRLKAGRAMVCTANYALDGLAHALAPQNPTMGMRLVSRLAEMCVPIEIVAKRDYRLLIAERRAAALRPV